MIIQQFEDKNLAHYSYAILSEGKVALVDPERDPKQYLDFAARNNATIVAIFETHPHADFISSHAELHRKTGAPIFVSELLSARYPHETFDEGDQFEMGKATFKPLNTPGHSPDSISIVLYKDGKPEAVFTGDTLFIGDCGRPDLREKAGALQAKREELAKEMYHSLRNRLMVLPDDVKVYPAHGAGTLCGKGLSSENVSTIGAEKATNWSLQEFTEEEFVKELLADQPFVPKYFPHSVEVNRNGAADFEASVQNVKISEGVPDDIDPSIVVIDSRDEKSYKQGALPNSINLMIGGQYETWLGSIVSPGEPFYLIAASDNEADQLVRRIAKIGYEGQIKEVFVSDKIDGRKIEELDLDRFKQNVEDFTVVDVRNASETKEGTIFPGAVTIPLPELRERVGELPSDKPVVVHCAAGYRSAAGTSIIRNAMNDGVGVYDLSTAIDSFKQPVS